MKAFGMDKDTVKFRKYMQDEQFKAICDVLVKYEGKLDGLTAAEVWSMTNNILEELKTREAADRDIYMTQVEMNLHRDLQKIERDGKVIERTKEAVRRSITCIFYCLALRLERTSKNPEANPHGDLIDCIVKKLIEMGDPVLKVLYQETKDNGDRREVRNGTPMDELNPLAEEEEWSEQWRRVAEHYAERMYSHVPKDRQNDYNGIWDRLKADEKVSAIMKRASALSGDEHKELGINYNAKAMFNLLGMMYDRGLFSGFHGVAPFAKAATEHYDKDTNRSISAKKEYFSVEKVGTEPKFIGLEADEMKHIKEIFPPKSIIKRG